MAHADFQKIFYVSFLFMYFFLTVLGFPCCADFSLVMESGGYSSAATFGLLIAVASLVAEQWALGT